MTQVRLLPVVVLAIAALLVLKTVGLVTNGGYVLSGVGRAEASGAAAPAGDEGGASLSLPEDQTMEDTSPTLADPAPTMEPQSAAAADHGGTAPAGNATAAPEAGAAAPVAAATGTPAADAPSGTYCLDSDAAIDADGNVLINPAKGLAPGEVLEETGDPPRSGDPMPAFAASMADCLPTGDAVPLLIDGQGGSLPLLSTDTATGTEQALLQRLSARRDELKKYEDDLALRASIVDAAEKRIEERTATLSALETQISTLVDQRQDMESGQFAGIVAMYETMKPKDAAAIFNNLDMVVLLQVAKTMAPRKMAPILAQMDTARAQELTVKMADLADRPATEMSPDDLAGLPQIVGQ